MENIEYSSIIPTLKSSIQLKKVDFNTCIVFDENTSRYFKISKSLEQLILLINGKNNLESICTIYNQQQNTNYSITQINNIIYNKLGEKIIASVANDTAVKNNSYIKNNKIIIGAKITNRISTKISFLYKSMLFFLVVLLFGYCIYEIIYMPKFIHLSSNLYLLIYPILIVLSTIVHEFGHATACNYYNIKSKGIGIGLFMGFMPVAYADVSEIWLLNKQQRIAVNFGGIYFETIFFIGIVAVSKTIE